jgi:hypothetical protein
VNQSFFKSLTPVFGLDKKFLNIQGMGAALQRPRDPVLVRAYDFSRENSEDY